MLSPEDQELLNSTAFGFLATVARDGSPHVSAVWTEYDDPHVVVATERSFAKTKNVLRDPRVAIAVIDMANPYREVVIFGDVVAVDDAEAAERTDALAKRYLSLDRFPRSADRTFDPVLLRIAVRRIARGPA